MISFRKYTAAETYRLSQCTFYDEVEKLRPWVALALNWTRVQAVIANIHFLYLKAVLVFVSNTGHYGHPRVHGPLVVSCENDACTVQPGSFRDPIQQVAPELTRDIWLHYLEKIHLTKEHKCFLCTKRYNVCCQNHISLICLIQLVCFCVITVIQLWVCSVILCSFRALERINTH